MTYTIEQLEALKEGITSGPWEAKDDHGGPNLFSPTGRLLCSDSCGDISGGEDDVNLMAAAPTLLDQLIAEKKAHQKLRKRIEERIRELKQPLCSHMPEGDELDDYVEQWSLQSYEAEMLTRILEGNA